jgi:hypothetical protein
MSEVYPVNGLKIINEVQQMIDREDNDRGDDEKQSLLTPSELAQEKENAALEEELRTSRQKAAEALEWQARQAQQIQNAAGNYRLFYRTWAVTASAIQLAGTTIGTVVSYIPFVNAIFNGLFFVIDMVEAIFISQETRNRRFVKAFNSTIGTGLTVASVVESGNRAIGFGIICHGNRDCDRQRSVLLVQSQ